ncbi:YajD family HNH nuclease [Thermodesulfobacteriota bacterium]
MCRGNYEQEKSCREEALKLFPWVCASCGREFSGKRLRELTVHHKDHDHNHTPPDGSNWELLCLYCHDNEHSRLLDSEWTSESTTEADKRPSTTHQPFAGLKGLLKDKK